MIHFIESFAKNKIMIRRKGKRKIESEMWP